MATLYKHISSKFALPFLDGSSVRIGTLGDFRRQEIHSAGIGDSLDASFQRNLDTPYPINIEPGSENAKIFADTHLIELGPNGRIENFTSSNTKIVERAPDCYILCVAASKNANLGYDNVITIMDIDGFARALTQSLYDYGLGTGDYAHGMVTYSENEGDFFNTSAGQAHAFLKGPEFQHQEEYRLIFRPRNSKIEPINLQVTWPVGVLGKLEQYSAI